MSAVLDASAILAMLQDEPGAEHISARLPGSTISAVNLSEVVAKLIDRGFDADMTRETLDMLALSVSSFGTSEAYQAGFLRGETRAQGLSFGDRACLALARQTGGTALTTDSAWSEIRAGIDVEVVR